MFSGLFFFWMLFHFHRCNMMRSHSLAGQADYVQRSFFPTEELQGLITCPCTSLAPEELDCVFVQWSGWYRAGTSLCLSVVPLFKRTENYCPQVSAVLCCSATDCGLTAVFPWVGGCQEGQGITASSCRNIDEVIKMGLSVLLKNWERNSSSADMLPYVAHVILTPCHHLESCTYYSHPREGEICLEWKLSQNHPASKEEKPEHTSWGEFLSSALTYCLSTDRLKPLSWNPEDWT